jgi:hypothetical protein
MTGNATTSSLKRAGTRKADCPAPDKQIAETATRAARLAEISRKYTLQVIVTDPKGHEIFNLTKMTLDRHWHDKGNTIPDIKDVIALLVDAAQEHVLPSD